MNPLVIIFLSVLLTCDSVPTTTESRRTTESRMTTESRKTTESSKLEDLGNFGASSDKPRNQNETTLADLYNDQYWSYLMECGGCYDACYYSCDDNSTVAGETTNKTAGDTEPKILRDAANFDHQAY